MLEARVASVPLGAVVAPGKREGLTALVDLVGCRLGHLVAVESYLANAKVEAREEDRKSVVSGKSVSVREDLGGRSIIKKKNELHTSQQYIRYNYKTPSTTIIHLIF